MKTRRRRFFLAILVSCLLAACAGAPPAPTVEAIPPTPTQQETATPDRPPMVSAYLPGAETLAFDEMGAIRYEDWDAVQARAEDGAVWLSQAGENSAFLGSKHGFQAGEAALLLIRFDEAAHFEIGMERGEWDTPAFKRWGLYKLEELGGNVWTGNDPLEPQGVFDGALTLAPGRWYYVLYVVGEGRGVQSIWEKDDPANAGEYAYPFETDWRGQTWNLIVQVFEGELAVDEFHILAGKPSEQAAAPTAPATETPAPTETPPPPQERAEVIFHNGQVLSMEAGLPVRQALATRGETILAVGDEAQILALADEETRLIDLDGNTLMPGFIDPHTHIFDSGTDLMGTTIEEAQQSAIENGVTGIAGFMNEDQVRTMQNMQAEGSLRLRTSVYLYATGACGEPMGTWYEAYPPTRQFGERLRINGIKIFADGGTCEYPAVTQETHPGAGLGNLWFSDQQMKDMVLEAHQAGYQVAIHALGDRAIRQAQDAIIYANGGPDNPLRHRIEHNYYLSDALLPRYQENGILATIFGQFPTCAVAGLERTDYWRATIARWRELLDANPELPIAAKSDTPYVGQEIPLLSLYSLTTLREVAPDGSVCTPPDWLAERAITIEEALPMVTTHAAYTLFREDETGSLETGKLADLIILSGNPLETAPEDLLSLEVRMTMIGGKVEYCATGYAALCP